MTIYQIVYKNEEKQRVDAYFIIQNKNAITFLKRIIIKHSLISFEIATAGEMHGHSFALF